MTCMFGDVQFMSWEKAIADGKKLPHWKPRSICCVNVGLSNKHASTVPLVLNPETGYITPPALSCLPTKEQIQHSGCKLQT